MKTETAIVKILNSDDTLSNKISRLQTLALRAFPSSPNQKAVNAARTILKETGSIAAAFEAMNAEYQKLA